jgi:hypothetical protein
MKTSLEIIEEIKLLSIEINKLKTKHFELHSVDNSEEWEQSFLTLGTKNARLDALTWVLS